MIDKQLLLNEFYRLHAKTNGTMYMDDVAEIINFSIVCVPLLLKAFPDNRDLLWQIRSFNRRAFRNALRIVAGTPHNDYAVCISDDLAKKAGFYQMKDGETVSIFDCIEIERDRIIDEDLDFYEDGN